ncbi:MAG: branched-chain amino acid ABC transporter permease [Thermodesulforhabdaceae bacterium]
MNRKKALLALILALLLLPFIVTSDYYRHVFILSLIWVIIGSSWNLLSGYAGQVSFGHAIFFGTGAYTAGLCVTKLHISAWWGMLFAGPVTMIVGFIIGWICFRLRGPYFALATIAFGEIFLQVAKVWKSLTGGMLGILIIQSFRSKIPYYYIGLCLAILCVAVVYKVVNSKWGYYFVAIREDQDAAEAIGVSAFRYKTIAIIISSFFTGLAGAFYMNYMAFIDPQVVFSLHYISIMAILVSIIGGVGTIWGPPLGAFIMVWLQETFRSSIFGLAPRWVSEAHVLAFGILVIIVIRYLPNGIIGDWHKIANFFSRKPSLVSQEKS